MGTVRNEPVWAGQLEPDEFAQLSPGLPERLEPRPDVLVVGGGILGVATAVACQEAGAGSVLLIEASRLGAGATGGAAGLLVPEAHQGVDPPALVELARASLARWRELGPGVGFRDLDWLGLAPHQDGFLADPPQDAEWLSTAEIAHLVPGLAPAGPAVRIRHQGRVNPLRALSRLAARIPQVATGCPATAVGVRGGRVRSVSTPAGVIAPGAVVFATGLPPRLDGLDPGLPAGTVKGHLIVTEPVPVALPGMVMPLATQLEDGALLAGGTLDTGDDTSQVRAEVADRIRAGLAAALPAAARARVTHQWCCRRPCHPDLLPVIDRVPGLDNAWLTSGHYRTGILMGPATGAALARWVTTGRPPALAGPLAIGGRFAARR
ncbi:MAG TPA: FAD-binding oxidoreductase [Streptosporangiaceae bacterium]